MSDHNILRVRPSTRRGRAPFEAHQLVRHPGTGRLSFSRRDWLRDLTAADRLTFGALRQLGLGYGWCCFCGKGLTDPRRSCSASDRTASRASRADRRSPAERPRTCSPDVGSGATSFRAAHERRRAAIGPQPLRPGTVDNDDDSTAGGSGHLRGRAPGRLGDGRAQQSRPKECDHLLANAPDRWGAVSTVCGMRARRLEVLVPGQLAQLCPSITLSIAARSRWWASEMTRRPLARPRVRRKLVQKGCVFGVADRQAKDLAGAVSGDTGGHDHHFGHGVSTRHGT